MNAFAFITDGKIVLNSIAASEHQCMSNAIVIVSDGSIRPRLSFSEAEIEALFLNTAANAGYVRPIRIETVTH